MELISLHIHNSGKKMGEGAKAVEKNKTQIRCPPTLMVSEIQKLVRTCQNLYLMRPLP